MRSVSKKKKVLALTDLICCKNQNNLNEVMHYPHLHDFHWHSFITAAYSISPVNSKYNTNYMAIKQILIICLRWLMSQVCSTLLA